MDIEDDRAERDSEAAAGTVSSRLRIGAALTGTAAVLLAWSTSLSLWDVIGLSLFYVLLPALAIAQLPLLRTERLERMPVYLGSALTILTIGVIGLLLGLRQEGPEALGLVGMEWERMLVWILGLTGVGILVIVSFIPMERAMGKGGAQILADLLPRTPEEKRAFVGLSASAGLGEELAYRGYALIAVQLLGPGPWLAAAVSSVAFGFLHAYQGAVGVVRTGVMGFVLAVPVVLTGSILPSIVAHTLIDLIAGLVLGPQLSRAMGGVEESPALVPPRTKE